jgi:hypothetical protein
VTELLAAIREAGLPTVLVALVVYVILRGEFVFRYPGPRGPRDGKGDR